LGITQIINKKNKVYVTDKYISNGVFVMKKEYAQKLVTRAEKVFGIENSDTADALVEFEERINYYFNVADSEMLDIDYFKRNAVNTIVKKNLALYKDFLHNYYFHIDLVLEEYFLKQYDLVPCTKRIEGIRRNIDTNIKLDYGFLREKGIQQEIVGIVCFMNF
jgi:uncharacterized Fe-S center protein